MLRYTNVSIALLAAVSLSACGTSISQNRTFDPQSVVTISPSLENQLAQPSLILHKQSDGTVNLRVYEDPQVSEAIY